MKKFISALGLLAVSMGLIANTSFAITVTSTTYSGPDETNYYADTVVTTNGSLTKMYETSDASDSDTNDITMNTDQGDYFYVGFDEQFDGFLIGFDGESTTGGSYHVSYYNGTSWGTLVSEEEEDIPNESGVFRAEWSSRPSDWTKTTISGVSTGTTGILTTTDSLYFARIDYPSDYDDSTIQASQIGIINYNFELTLEDELGNAITSDMENTFESALYDATIRLFDDSEGNGVYKYGFYTTDSTSEKDYSLTQKADGFVTVEEENLELSKARTETTLEMDYAIKVTAVDSSTGAEVTLTSLTGGSSGTSCKISSGDAYCAIPEDEDNSSATAYASGYESKSFTLPNRTADTDAQKTATISMTKSSSPSDYPDLTVDDLYLNDDALVMDVSNEGGKGVLSSDGSVWIYAYVDDVLKYSGSYSYTYFSAGEDNLFTILDGTFDEEDETYNVEVCIDATDNVDEDDESDNCRTENLSTGGTSADGPDLTVDDLYLNDDALKIKLENEGNEDVDNDDTIYLYVYVDDEKEYSATVSYTYLEEGETMTVEVLDGTFDDEDETYEVEACIDAKDYVDESDEDNNCRTENLTQGSSGSGPDLEVIDIYLDDDSDDVMIDVKNSGNDNVDSGETVWIYAYVDGDTEWSKSASQSSSTTNWLDEDEEDTYNLGDIDDLTEGHGTSYEIEVCVDAKDEIDEDSESNNCMTVDEDTIDQIIRFPSRFLK